MKLLQQPPRSYVCGQTSVAMIAGITAEESYKLFGHQKATYFTEHIKVLTNLGFEVEKFKKVDNRKKYTLPDLCLVRIGKSGRRMGHMVAYNKGKFYDPAKGIFNSKEDLLKRYPKWRIEYYLEIQGKNTNNVVELPKRQQLKQVAGDEKRYKVRVSHDIFKKGYKEYVEREISVEELENLKKSTTFTIESYEIIGVKSP